MNITDLSSFSKFLLEEGIANTYEYPGFISIQYRKHQVTIGIEEPEMLVQIDDNDGTEIASPSSFKFGVKSFHNFYDLLPRVKNILSHAYSIIDDVYSTQDEEKLHNDLVAFVSSIAWWMQGDQKYDVEAEVNSKILEARKLEERLKK